MEAVPEESPIGFARIFVERSGLNRLRLNAATRLFSEGADLVDETGKHSLGGSQLILVLQATRATHLFEGVIALCQIGRGVPAAMLARALIDDALEAHWVSAHPKLAPDRAQDHDDLLHLSERRAYIEAGKEAAPLDEGEEERLTDLLRLYRGFHASWTRESVGTMRDLVGERWGEEARSNLDFVYDVIQRQNNFLVHGSPGAYRQAMSVDDDGQPVQVNRAGPDRRWVDSLAHASLGYYFVLRVVAEDFRIDKDPAAAAFHELSCVTKRLDPAFVRSLPPGRACPCGSGRAVEGCHAA